MSTPDKASALAALKARRQQAAAGANANASTASTASAAAGTAANAAVASTTSSAPGAPAVAGPGPRSSAAAPTRAAGTHARAPSSSGADTSSSAGASASASAIPSGISGLGAASSASSRAATSGAAASSSSGLSSGAGGRDGEGDDSPLPMRTVEAFAWVCGMCERECVPVRSESRCLCGHRLREHGAASAVAPSRCKAAKCGCVGFFYVVAEGSWVLRCRCKHKHTEHNAAHPTRGCAKPGCGCGAFDSPWVCNCDHPWAAHRQIVTQKQVVAVRDLMGGLSLAEAPAGLGGGGGDGGPAAEVNNYDGLKRGQLGPEALGHM